MEQENFDAKLAKLSHDIDQLDAKIDDKISSLREELRKEILLAYFAQIKDTSFGWVSVHKLNPSLSQVCDRVYNEIAKLSTEYIKVWDKLSADECLKNLTRLKEDVNRITRAAGLGELWKAPKS